MPGPRSSTHSQSQNTRCSSPAIDQSSLERILASQQTILMNSFQMIMNNLVSSQSCIAAPTTISNLKMRMNDPDVFDGSPKSTDSFLNSCLNLFVAQPSVYCSDESKIRFALSFFKFGSINWRDAVIRDMNDPLYAMPSWSEFEDSVRDSFGNPHRVENAQRELHQIVQGNRTAEEFFIAFEDLKHVAGFCDMSIIFQLKRALRTSVRNELLRRRPTPTTYRGWKEAILQVDQDLLETTAANAFYAPRPQTAAEYPFRPLTNVVFCRLGGAKDTSLSKSNNVVTSQQLNTSIVPAKPVSQPASMIEVEDAEAHLQRTLNPSENNELCTHIDCEPLDPRSTPPETIAKATTPKESTEEYILNKCRKLYPNTNLITRVLVQWVNHGRKSEVDNSLIKSLLFLDQHLALTILTQLRLPRAQLENYRPETIGKLDNSHSVVIPLSMTPTGSEIAKPIHEDALLDCGASGWGYLHHNFVAVHNLPTQPLAHPVSVYNADGTRNTSGSITHSASMHQ
ncbi:hypothetical protein GALMADRAFT_144566 [Galerina marginata CBS 339.88]|uniref:Retrotransposon gag domain-containing protein n=1 Tax=Galerina marginata (strain CBS 339.88) TaxID=685588 RepID=A0A067SIC8_GALM3|nr:hypothetical protein GALMADRAFT_144566 [Galerina marginata CBS 339.88]